MDVDIRDRLVHLLQAKGEILPTSLAFASLKTNVLRVNFVYDLYEANALFPELTKDGKSNVKSAEFRQKGNEMFKKKKPREAVEFYTQSVACAENGSEYLALAYANRSAVLFENGLYEECLSDINKALQNHYPEHLRSKLDTRKFKAQKLLLSQVPKNLSTSVPSISKENRNPVIQCATSSIKIEDSDVLGRHVVATKDIEPGEIIAIEEPLFKILIEQFYIHCHKCLKLCYNLIPCTMCTQTLYCSETCREQAKEYHQYECPILLTIREIGLDKLEILAMVIGLLVTKNCVEVDDFTRKKDDEYRSDRYAEIHDLVGNTEKRSVSDLFNRASTTAVIFYLVKRYTTFFDDNDDVMYEDTFKDLVLHHRQTGACNFHEITELKSADHSFDTQEIGAGAYSFLSMFNHSCSPNIIRYSNRDGAVVIAIETIKKGEQCFDNYGYHYAVMPKPTRHQKIKKQYFFDCVCQACEENYPLYQNLPQICPSEEAISSEDMKSLKEYNVAESQKIFKKAIGGIKKYERMKPNRSLAEYQELMKQCCVIFETVTTPF